MLLYADQPLALDQFPVVELQVQQLNLLPAYFSDFPFRHLRKVISILDSLVPEQPLQLVGDSATDPPKGHLLGLEGSVLFLEGGCAFGALFQLLEAIAGLG